MKILLALVAWASLARADSPNEIEARRRYAEAQKLFDRARFGDALAEFEASYALSGYPAIVHKIAMCHDQLGHVDQAIESYQRYLALEPATERRAGIEERIATLERTRAAPPPTVEEPKPKPVPPVIAAAVERPKPRPVYKKWWLWTIVGVAAAGAALGIGLGVGLSGGSSFNANLHPIGPGL